MDEQDVVIPSQEKPRVHLLLLLLNLTRLRVFTKRLLREYRKRYEEKNLKLP